MIELVSRKEVLDQAGNLAQEIAHIQNLMFEDDPELFENEQDQMQYGQMFDLSDFKISTVQKTYKIVSLNHTDIQTFSSRLSKLLFTTLAQLGVDKIYIISHLKMNFFGANLKHSFAPIKSAYKKLKSITGGDFFDGAFIVNVEDLPELLEIAFWIERCDASAPEFIFFHDNKDRFTFYLCNRGCIHLIEYGNELLSSEILKNSEFSKVEGKCNDKFGNGKIEGRITSAR
ncbi:MAG: hypothetical protein EOP48_06630 [Sphingobacteriales bacterium]|nr:MAG: hypothetical protein EOP48_06630 [Sphingobacteriales bacterium]